MSEEDRGIAAARLLDFATMEVDFGPLVELAAGQFGNDTCRLDGDAAFELKRVLSSRKHIRGIHRRVYDMLGQLRGSFDAVQIRRLLVTVGIIQAENLPETEQAYDFYSPTIARSALETRMRADFRREQDEEEDDNSRPMRPAGKPSAPPSERRRAVLRPKPSL